MKKSLIAASIVGVFALTTSAQTLTEQHEESLVRGIIPNTKIEKVTRSEIDGLYKAYLSNGNILYVNPFKRLLFIGEVWTNGGVSLTASDRDAWQNELANKILTELKASELTKNAKKVVYGNGSKQYDIIIFTDPECPYCAKLDEFLETKNVNVYVNFYPLSFHKNADRWSEQILSSKDIKAAMKQIRTTQKDLEGVKITKDAQKTLKATKALAEKVGIRGTPKIFIVDRKNKNKLVESIDGANTQKIKEYLDKDGK